VKPRALLAEILYGGHSSLQVLVVPSFVVGDVLLDADVSLCWRKSLIVEKLPATRNWLSGSLTCVVK